MNWYPISTAPSGGVQVLVADEGLGMAVVRIDNVFRGRISIQPPIDFVPTHWAPTEPPNEKNIGNPEF